MLYRDIKTLLLEIAEILSDQDRGEARSDWTQNANPVVGMGRSGQSDAKARNGGRQKHAS